MEGRGESNFKHLYGFIGRHREGRRPRFQDPPSVPENTEGIQGVRRKRVDLDTEETKERLLEGKTSASHPGPRCPSITSLKVKKGTRGETTLTVVF